MKLEIISLHNRGDVEKEYVLMEAKSDCDVGRYVLSDSTYTAAGKVSNKLRHIYWFPDKEVNKGDLVSLRTGTGKNTTLTNASGTTIHRFFWGLKTAVWNDDGDCAVLIEAKTWQLFPTK